MKKILLPLAMAALFFTGCSHDDDNYVPVQQAAHQFDGSLQSIEQFLTPQLLHSMQDLGVVFNTGSTPPDLSGDYLASILKLQASNITDDVIDTVFSDATLHFSNQDNQNHTVNFSYSQTSGEIGSGEGTLVSGNGNKFTALLNQKVYHDTEEADAVLVITGTKTSTGITDFQLAFFVKDNHGNASFIPNDSGRIFYDADGLVANQ